MTISKAYQQQAALLLQCLPFVAQEDCFALKGGTAINFFIRDLPRLSVDIDLAYLPVQPRPESLQQIDEAMGRIALRIREALPEAAITSTRLTKENAVVKLLIRSSETQIKIEVTPVLRGCVFEPEIMDVSPTVEDTFGFAQIQVVSFSDLYAGKFVAALDRQHPRDLFDVREFLSASEIDDALRRAFIVYMISHNRPMSEVLRPTLKDISDEYERGFVGMTTVPVALDDLLEARNRLISVLVDHMPEEHREFLIGFEEGAPNWQLLDIPDVENLPAIRWRQQNLDKLDANQGAALVNELKKTLWPK